MRKFLILCTLILSMGLGYNIVMANEHFEPTHKNTKSGKEYGIKEEYRVRELENGKLEIEFKKGFFTIVNKDEISTICDLDATEDMTSTDSFEINKFNTGIIVKFKTIKVYGNSSYFPYNKYYDEYDNDANCWYGNNLTLKEIVCKDENTYVAIYGEILVITCK